MSDKQNITKNEKENIEQIKENKNKTIINMDKDQLFKSFLLFQDFLSKNQNLINENNIKKENINEIKQVLTHNNIKNDNYMNKLIEEKERKSEDIKERKEQSLNDINNNNNTSIQLYDEIPIKSTGYNFVELLEKSLANEETIKEKDKNKLNIKINEDSNEKENFISTKEKSEQTIINNKIVEEKEKNITGFINKEENVINNKSNNDNEIKNESECDNKADIITKEINKVSIIQNIEEKIINKNKENIINQDNLINNGKETLITTNLNTENNSIINIIDSKNIESREKINEIYPIQINDLDDSVNDNKENINMNNNQKIIMNNNKIKKYNDINIKDNKLLSDKNFQLITLENGSSLNKEKLVQKKIKELNSEIIKFREEKAKIIKLKSEYEKIQAKLKNDVEQFNIKKAEFEKYRDEEMNKIRIEKKKLMAENKAINNVKFQNQSYAMMIKKDKETIEHLKKQIEDYQQLLKQKETENKNNKISFVKKYGIINKKLEEIRFDNTKKKGKRKGIIQQKALK
jgi:hypothetical protein